MEKVTLEVLGIAVVAAVSYGITKLVTIAPFDRNYSADENVWMLISIPTVIYIIYRAYFGFVIFCCSKIRFPRIEKLFRAALVVVGFGSIFLLPQVQDIIQEVYTKTVGDLPAILWQQSEPQVNKAVSFGLRVFALLTGWFIALWIIENILKAILWVSFSVLRLISFDSKRASASDGPSLDSPPQG